MRLARVATIAALAGLVLGCASAPTASAAVGQPSGARPAMVRGSTWLLRNTLTSGGADVQFSFGLPTDAKVMGDWNGDGTRTPGVFRRGTWYLRDRNGAGGRYFSFTFGQAGDLPVVGDWNGDGIESVGFFRSGGWHLRNANSPGPSNILVAFGAAGDLPVAGDWNGDGIDTIGFFRSGGWHLRNANSPGPSAYLAAFGSAGDMPVTGDWNRDGTDSIGFVRGAGWHLRNTISAGSSNLLFSYGLLGDTPLRWTRVQTTVPAGLRGTEWTALPTSRRVVALTFDAGANADGVPKIMAALRSAGVPGTFFLTGRWVEQYPNTTAQIGTYFPIGNHTYSHPDLTTLPDDQVRSQLALARARIQSATSQDPRPLFRFPFGARDTRTIGLVNSLGYGSIRWTVDTLGWQGTSGGRSVQSVVARVLANLRPGEIVLMHVGSHPTDHSTLDADALPTIISALQRRGYQFTTVRQYT